MAKAKQTSGTGRKTAKRTPAKRSPAAKAKTSKAAKQPTKRKVPPKKAAPKKKPAAKRSRSSSSGSAAKKKAEPVKVYAAVERDLAELGKRDSSIPTSARAALALALAEAIDDPKASPTSKSMNGRALNDTLDRLLELAPEPEEKDNVADLQSRREIRRRAGSK